MIKLNSKGGISILGLLLLGLVLILVLSYFHISIRAVIENPDTQDNFNYVGGAGESIWVRYLQKPVSYAWNEVWIPYFWQPFVNVITNAKEGAIIDFGTQIKILPNSGSQ